MFRLKDCMNWQLLVYYCIHQYAAKRSSPQDVNRQSEPARLLWPNFRSSMVTINHSTSSRSSSFIVETLGAGIAAGPVEGDMLFWAETVEMLAALSSAGVSSSLISSSSSSSSSWIAWKAFADFTGSTTVYFLFKSSQSP